MNATIRCIKAGLTFRIITTSVAEHHLDVLWGEIGRFVMTAKYPLLHKHGGPLVMHSMELRRAEEWKEHNPLSYVQGKVSAKGEGLAGHHADYTLFVGDEASGLDDVAYEMAQGWANRMLIFGNPNPCSNFFKHGVKAGDLVAA